MGCRVKRWYSLDILRGCALILAVWQHYFYLDQAWFYEYVDLDLQPSGVSTTGFVLCSIFTPWVSHIFIFLASFNLALVHKTPLYRRRLWWLAYFVVMLLENYLVAPNLDEALTMQPIHIGILCMFSVSFIQEKFRLRGVAVAFGLFLLTLPWLWQFGDMLEAVLQIQLGWHDFEYNARLEYFFGTSCLGVLLGHWLWHIPTKRTWALILIGLLCLIPWLIFGSPYRVDPQNVFANEYLLSRELVGLLAIWGWLTALTSGLVNLERIGWNFSRWHLIIWISLNTWTIFATHRLAYVYVYGPLRQRGPSPFLEILLFTVLSLGVVWLFQKLKIHAKQFLQSKS